MGEYTPPTVPMEPEVRTHPLLSNASYDRLKTLVTLVLPALGTLYFTIAQIWGLPAAEQVVGTITAVCLAFGTVLGLSSQSYSRAVEQAEADKTYDGTLHVIRQNGETSLVAEVSEDPTALATKSEVIFRLSGH